MDATCLNKIPEKSTVKIETTVKEASGGPKKQSSLLNFFKKNKTLWMLYVNVTLCYFFVGVTQSIFDMLKNLFNFFISAFHNKFFK